MTKTTSFVSANIMYCLPQGSLWLCFQQIFNIVQLGVSLCVCSHLSTFCLL